VQGIGDIGAGIFWKYIRSVCVPVICCLLLAGCGTGQTGVDTAALDRSILTGSVGSGAKPVEPEFESDKLTIQNAVSSADLARFDESGVAWANAETGSAGLVQEITERSRNGVICRSFTARRESFDGVALYKGVTCLNSDGLWKMRLFDAV
jgi:hypothetical protein